MKEGTELKRFESLKTSDFPLSKKLKKSIGQTLSSPTPDYFFVTLCNTPLWQIKQFSTYIILIKEHMQLSHAYSQVSFIEFIRNIPTEWPKFSSFLNQCVEEAQTKQKFLEFMLKMEFATVRIKALIHDFDTLK